MYEAETAAENTGSLLNAGRGSRGFGPGLAIMTGWQRMCAVCFKRFRLHAAAAARNRRRPGLFQRKSRFFNPFGISSPAPPIL